MKLKIPKMTYILKRTTAITIATWLVVIGLFLLQYFVKINNKDTEDFVVGAMFFVFIFVAIPATLLCVIDWLKFLAFLSEINWLPKIVSYIVLMGFSYLVGDFISFLIEHRVPYLAFKMVVVIHLIAVLWMIYGILVEQISKWVFKILKADTGVLPNWLMIVIGVLIGVVVYKLIYNIVNRLPIVQWIF